jgi:hypothetical protein
MTQSTVPPGWRLGSQITPSARKARGSAAPRTTRPLGARVVVVELHTECHATKLSTRAWAITRRADRAHRRQADCQQRAARSARTDRPHQPQERGTVADAR